MTCHDSISLNIFLFGTTKYHFFMKFIRWDELISFASNWKKLSQFLGNLFTWESILENLYYTKFILENWFYINCATFLRLVFQAQIPYFKLFHIFRIKTIFEVCETKSPVTKYCIYKIYFSFYNNNLGVASNSNSREKFMFHLKAFIFLNIK